MSKVPQYLGFGCRDSGSWTRMCTSIPQSTTYYPCSGVLFQGFGFRVLGVWFFEGLRLCRVFWGFGVYELGLRVGSGSGGGEVRVSDVGCVGVRGEVRG